MLLKCIPENIFALWKEKNNNMFEKREMAIVRGSMGKKAWNILFLGGWVSNTDALGSQVGSL